MGFWRKIARCSAAAVLVCTLVLAADFEWNWRDQLTIGRNDPSLGNTSKLSESERNALLDAVITRLLKPMSDRGYDDSRIREIALTTRLRFVDLGEGKPVIMATSLGLEGGCDAKSNCPFWIFRHSDDGYLSVLDAVAASYTIQPTSSNGFSDLVLAHHDSASETRLALYTYADGKYSGTGCYTAKWPAPKDGEVQDPDIAACATEGAKPEQSQSPNPTKVDESNPAKAGEPNPAKSQDSGPSK